MSTTSRLVGSCIAVLAVSLFAACQSQTEVGFDATGFAERAARRAYEGAPPVMPHRDFSQACEECHGRKSIEVAGVGLSPASPHGRTSGMAVARCEQCHVSQAGNGLFASNSFAGLVLDPDAAGTAGIHGDRFNPLAPPRIPHRIFLRENCSACHTGPAARPEIRTSHPERERCQQCHVEIAEVRASEPSVFSPPTSAP